MKLALLLFGMIFSVALFLTLDSYRSAAIRRSSTSQTLANGCETPDRVREHALKPNCASTAHWGSESYPFYTNNLGFRDEALRPVSKTEERPRILILGDSFTEGMGSWPDTYVGMIAARFPEYEFLNGGVTSYSPSKYLNTARMLLAEGIQFDEVIVFIDISDVQDEAAFYREVDSSGAVTGPQRKPWVFGRYERWRSFLAHRLLMTNYLFELLQRALVALGYYHLTMGLFGDTLDMERSAWTYRKVNERDGFYPSGAGYAPLGVKGGIAKEKAKMNLLWQDLEAGGRR